MTIYLFKMQFCFKTEDFHPVTFHLKIKKQIHQYLGIAQFTSTIMLKNRSPVW